MIRHFKRSLSLTLTVTMLFQVPALADYYGSGRATADEWILDEETLMQNLATASNSNYANKATVSDADEVPLVGTRFELADATQFMTAGTIDVDDAIDDSDLADAAFDSGGIWSYDPSGKTITVFGDVVLTGSSTVRRIVVEPGAEVQITVRDLSIDRSSQASGAAIELGAGSDLTLLIEGDNLLIAGGNCAGIQAPEGTRLFIDAADDNQKLECLSGYRAAGIGGGDEQNGGLIHIAGGEVIASGRSSAIGGGASMWGTNFMADVIISGGKVTAIGLIGSTVGIGGLRSGGSVVISGGTIDIQVNGGSIDPNRAICVPNGEIVITGGNITATTGMIGTPVNQDGARVYLAELPPEADVTSLSVDGNAYYTNGNYADSNFLNLYLTGEDHVVDVETGDVANKRYLLTWLDSSSEPYFNITEDTSGVLPVDAQISLELMPERLIYGTGETELEIKAVIDRDTSINTRAMDFISLYFNDESTPFTTIPVYDNQVETVLDLSSQTAGVYTIKAQYSGGYGQNPGSISETFVIAEPFSMSTEVIYEAQQTYTGGSITPEVTVIHGGMVLIPDQDYICNYQQNTVVGTAMIVVEGINRYDGTINRAFSINPALAQNVFDVPENMIVTAYDVRLAHSSSAVIEMMALPETVSVLTNSAGTVILPVEWATQTPFDAKGAIYQVTGTVSGNDNIVVNDIVVNTVIEVTPVVAVKPEFDNISVGAGRFAAATADVMGSDILPLSGQLRQNHEMVEYQIDWNGGQTLDLTKDGQSQTFTGTIDYVVTPEWMTLPADLTVSRTVTVKGQNSSSSHSSSDDSDGIVSGWFQDRIGWQYIKADGKKASSEWKQLNGTWYYFDPTGYMAQGWRLLNEKWYWLLPETGRMASNEWVWYQDNWYYFDVNGSMVTGWQEYQGNFYYLSEEIDRYLGHMFQNQMTPDGQRVDENGKQISS